MLIFASCSKVIEIEPNKPNIQSTNCRESNDSTFIIEINGFIENLANPENVPDMNINDVVYFIEATLNYKHADPSDLDYEDIIEGEFTKNYELTGEGNLVFSDVVSIYNEYYAELSNVYSTISYEDKLLLITDVELVEGQNQIKLHFVFGAGNVSLQTNFEFRSTDYWYYGGGLGKWGAYSGQGIGSDAADQLTKMYLSYRAYNSNVPIGRPVATNVNNVTLVAGFGNLIINPNDDNPQDNWFDYLLFHGYNGWSNYHTGLSPYEMNFYFNALINIISNQSINYNGKELVYTLVDDASASGAIMHGLTNKWANVHYVPYQIEIFQ